ncbi:hypothetical protein ABI59_08755 [Acidobacteria bacterium Mor1]|nr:hypothetical protein ABI59_08755 [Acidobacteria bacterium Mor1]
MSHQDRDHEQALAELARRRDGSAPPLEHLLQRRPSARRPVLLPALGLGAAAAAVAMMLWLGSPAEPAPEPVSLTAWRAPTDVFLPRLDSMLSGAPPLGDLDLKIYTADGPVPEPETGAR